MLDVRTFWAGDSRCYYLTENGLAQLTADDTKLNPDSWESLSQDAPLTNYLSEEKNQLREERFQLPLPGLLICCSDGAWGFVGSPMHLEELLLSTVTDKLSAVDAVRRLADHFRSVAGDDVSLIMHPVGFRGVWHRFRGFFRWGRTRGTGVVAGRPGAPCGRALTWEIWRSAALLVQWSKPCPRKR